MKLTHQQIAQVIVETSEEIKETSKKMFLSGEWDATSKLLENKDLIENKLNDLPYIKFNN